jgi:hypothetical protein
MDNVRKPSNLLVPSREIVNIYSHKRMEPIINKLGLRNAVFLNLEANDTHYRSPHYPSLRYLFLRIYEARLLTNYTQKLPKLLRFRSIDYEYPNRKLFPHAPFCPSLTLIYERRHTRTSNTHPVFVTTNAQRLRGFLFFSLRLCRKCIAVVIAMSEERSCSRAVWRKRTSLIECYH